MTFKYRALLATLLVASSALAINAAQAQSSKPPTLSSAVGRSLGKAQDEATAKKWPEALADAKAGLAAAQSDYDKLESNRVLTTIELNNNDLPAAAAAAGAAADLPAASIPDAEKKDVYYAAAAMALNVKQYAKAAIYAKQLQTQPNTNDAKDQEVISKSLLAAGDPAAIGIYQKQVDDATAAGKAPSHDSLAMLMYAQNNAKDMAGVKKTMMQTILYYNQKSDWAQIFDVVISTPGTRDVDAVQLGRLLFICGADVTPDNAELIGQTTQKLALYGDAQTAVSKGAKLTLDPARIAADKASLPQQVQMGAGQNGLFNVKLGEAFYGYGMYPEAETAARLAQSKGLDDVSEAVMLIGMSQTMQGKYADAVATFGTVKGGSATTPDIVQLWTIYAKIKGGMVPAQQAAAAPAPAPAR